MWAASIGASGAIGNDFSRKFQAALKKQPEGCLSVGYEYADLSLNREVHIVLNRRDFHAAARDFLHF
mgnify:CR=1 FL=1